MIGEGLGHVDVPPEAWIGSGRATVVLTFGVDAETILLLIDSKYAGHTSTLSHQAYGLRVGLPRILEALERHEVPGTFWVPGMIAEKHPEAIASILEAGQEVAAHGYAHKSPVDLTVEEQEEEFVAGLEALSAIGAQPCGFRAPSVSATPFTLGLVARHGLSYDSSLMDADRPYMQDTPAGSFVEIPTSWCLDDWEQYAFLPDPDVGSHIELPRKVLDLWSGELDAMRSTQSLCVVTCHPELSGRPSRLRVLEEFIEFARGCGDVEFADCRTIATSVSAHHAGSGCPGSSGGSVS